MLKNLYILSEGSWGIKSSEIFADLFYTLSLSGFFVLYAMQITSILWLPLVFIFCFAVIYYYLARKYKYSVYPVHLFGQVLLFILLSPISFLHPVLISLAFISALTLTFLFNQKYSIHFALSLLSLFFVYVWDFVFVSVGYPFRLSEIPEIQFPWIAETTKIGIPFAYPFLLNGMEVASFVNPFEKLGMFALVGISWVSFRRNVLFFYFVTWNLLFFFWFMGSGNPFFPWGIGFASIAFVVHIAPGRNFYGSFYLSLLCFFIFAPISFLVGNLGLSPMMIVVLFFLTETILVRVFLGK